MGGGSSFRTYARETDMPRVGNGTPSVVQVHDPQCGDCTALPRATRKNVGLLSGSKAAIPCRKLRHRAGAACLRPPTAHARDLAFVRGCKTLAERGPRGSQRRRSEGYVRSTRRDSLILQTDVFRLRSVSKRSVMPHLRSTLSFGWKGRLNDDARILSM